MKHPTQEQWMAYLYGESAAAEKDEMSAHLAQCADCRDKVSRWRGVMNSLDDWKLPAAAKRPLVQPMMKWGIAAALILGLGCGLGMSRLFSKTESVVLQQQMRREFQAELKSALDNQRVQLLTEATRMAEEKRAGDKQEMAAAIRRISAAQRADYNYLQREVETMAVMTETSLRQTHQELNTLANTTEPGTGSTTQ
ncbi:anti-sigma factor family protein [Pedosphaera parvula]|nr:zf-HC2 domain-containing protein [Pedosphaera parvula]